MTNSEIALYMQALSSLHHYLARPNARYKALLLLINGASNVDCYVLCESVEQEFFGDSAVTLEELAASPTLRDKPIVLSPKVMSVITKILSSITDFSASSSGEWCAILKGCSPPT